MKQSIGEAQITPQAMQQLTPDVVSPQGKQELFRHLAKANIEKQPLDLLLATVAQHTGADFSSRIKNPQTAVQKIAQKRLQGRDYGIKDVNDAYGGRLVVDDARDVPAVSKVLEHIAQRSGIKVLKSEDVDEDTYHAHHIDLQTPSGTKAEVQIMQPQEQLEAAANHSLRAVYGEHPIAPVEQLKDKQAAVAKQVSDNKAKAMAHTLTNLSQANQDQPLDPRIVAQVLKKT